MSKEISKDRVSSLIRKKRLLKSFQLTKEEKNLIESSDQTLKENIIKDIEAKINTCEEKINEINNDKHITAEEKKHRKKYLVVKVRKYRAELKEESFVNNQLKLLKIQKRKLKARYGKISARVDKFKKRSVVCLKCKKRGHSMNDCTETIEEVQEESKPKIQNNQQSKEYICYNCGSTTHSLAECSKPVNYAHLPFSECFICKEKGHLSSSCPKNKHGIYIRGGSCYICKKKDHLAKNCPEKQSILDEKENKISKSFKSSKRPDFKNKRPTRDAPQKFKNKQFLNKKRKLN
jgi:hypothetical protein